MEYSHVSGLAGSSEKLKIVHVIVGLNVGGAELMLNRLLRAHEGNAEYEHCVISLTTLGKIGLELEQRGVKVLALGMRDFWSVVPKFLLLRRLLAAQKPDIVQTWMYHADFLGGLAARSIGIRHIVWGIRTTDISSSSVVVTRFIRKMCACLSYFVPAVIVCAANAARTVHAGVGYDEKKMVVVSNGFDIDRLIADSLAVDELRKDAGLSDRHLVVGSVGRFHSVKNHFGFIQAASLLARSYPHLRFMMIGRDVNKNNRQLMDWINTTGVPENFVLLGERDDMAVCFAAMDIYCLHSLTEGFPNALGEAMSMGKPCVAVDVGDSKFLLGSGGVVVENNSPTQIAKGIEELLHLEKADLLSIGEASRMRIYRHFTMGAAQKKYEEIYLALVAIA